VFMVNSGSEAVDLRSVAVKARFQCVRQPS